MQTITKVYGNYGDAKNAVIALEASGIPTANISILANGESGDGVETQERSSDAVQGAGLGAVAGGAAGLLTALGVMAIPGLGPIVAAGWLATTAVGMVAGGATGGIVGSLMNSGVTEEHAQVYAEAVKRGGTLVTVRAEDEQMAETQRIMDTYQPMDPIIQAAAYRKDGWSKFEPNGILSNKPYSEETRRHL